MMIPLNQVVCSGAWVEDKKISVTYHYKGVNDKLKAKLIEQAKGLIQGHGFQLIETPYALEGKPRVNWDKGKWRWLKKNTNDRKSWWKKWKNSNISYSPFDASSIPHFM